MFQVNPPKPFSVPAFPIESIAKEGIGSLSPIDSTSVYGCGWPEKIIFRARLRPEELRLDEFVSLVSPQTHTRNANNFRVEGYGDPTSVSQEAAQLLGQENPGFLCGQAYLAGDGELRTDLVFFDHYAGEAKTILTPQMVADSKICWKVWHVREGEVFSMDGRAYLLFEFDGMLTDGAPNLCHIGCCCLKDGKLGPLQTLWTAQDDRSAHVSTCGSPVKIDRNWTMFFNRRRGASWGIAYGLLSRRGERLRLTWPCKDWLVAPHLEAPPEIPNYGGIAGSYVQTTDHGVELWTQTYGGAPNIYCLARQ